MPMLTSPSEPAICFLLEPDGPTRDHRAQGESNGRNQRRSPEVVIRKLSKASWPIALLRVQVLSCLAEALVGTGSDNPADVLGYRTWRRAGEKLDRALTSERNRDSTV